MPLFSKRIVKFFKNYFFFFRADCIAEINYFIVSCKLWARQFFFLFFDSQLEIRSLKNSEYMCEKWNVRISHSRSKQFVMTGICVLRKASVFPAGALLRADVRFFSVRNNKIMRVNSASWTNSRLSSLI